MDTDELCPGVRIRKTVSISAVSTVVTVFIVILTTSCQPASTPTPTVRATVTRAVLQSATPLPTASPLSEEPTEQIAPLATEDFRTPGLTEFPSLLPTLAGVRDPIVTDVVVTPSQGEIGNGTLLVYYDRSIEVSKTTRIELEMVFNNYFVTPTPFGRRTQVPAPTLPIFSTLTALPPGTQNPTPRVPQFVDDPERIFIFRKMGASLICLPTSFQGCDSARIQALRAEDLQDVEFDGMEWSWIISPVTDAQGRQDLRIVLWALLEADDGTQSIDDVWTYPFMVGVTSVAVATSAMPAGILVALVGITSAVIAFLIIKRRREVSPPKTVNDRADSVSSPLNIFISYRRSGGTGYAQLIHNRLTARGASVFIDVEDIHEGRFEDYIKKSIAECDYFVVVLAPETLASEWVKREIEYAIETKRKIIPILVDGFSLYGEPLPTALLSLRDQNAITLLPEYVNSAIDRLYQFVGLETS